MNTSATPLIKIKRLPHSQGLALPTYESQGAAGMDLCAAVPADAPLCLHPGAWVKVATGFAMALPSGYEAQIRPRSGLAAKHALSVPNSPGTIDSDYRGEIQVLLINHGTQDFTIERGMRIAQMVIAPVVQAHLKEVAELDETKRGSGGFGSTGTGEKSQR